MLGLPIARRDRQKCRYVAARPDSFYAYRVDQRLC